MKRLEKSWNGCVDENITHYAHIIAKPKKFFKIRKFLGLDPYIIDHMFHTKENPEEKDLPKGFKLWKNIGKSELSKPTKEK